MTTLRFFGTLTVALTGDAPAVRRLADLWAPFAVAGPAPPGCPAVRADDPALASAELNRTVVARCPHPAVHAGVVGLRDGAVALPATSGAGKSTLVTALCRAGAAYLSDEALVMTGDGAAVPYPKPVALSAASLRALDGGPAGAGPADDGREHLVPAAATGRVVRRPLPVRHLVLARRDPDAPDVALEQLPRRDGLAALLGLGFNHYRAPDRFLTSAAAVVRGATVWRLVYGDVRRAAAVMSGVLP